MTSVAKRDKWCKHRVSPQKTRDNPFVAFWQSRTIIYGGSSKSMEPKPRVKDVQYCLLEGNRHSSLKHIYQFSGSLTPQNDKCTLDQPWLAGKSSLWMVFFIFNPSFRGILQLLITLSATVYPMVYRWSQGAACRSRAGPGSREASPGVRCIFFKRTVSGGFATSYPQKHHCFDHTWEMTIDDWDGQ